MRIKQYYAFNHKIIPDISLKIDTAFFVDDIQKIKAILR